MAYYIFLKTLRSLEKFRKNPHIKIPPKSPPTNFQSLSIFKNAIFIPKRIFHQLLTQSAQQPTGLFDLLALAAFFLPHRTGRAPPPPLTPLRHGRRPPTSPAPRSPNGAPQ
jgi:hypothetical protein